MPEFVLKAKTGLNHDTAFFARWSGFSAREIAGQHVWWAGVSAHAAEALAKALQKHLGCDTPAAGRFCDGRVGESEMRVVWAGNRQYFLMGALAIMPPALENALHFTDQSDGWLGLRIKGAQASEVLSRLCGLDFHAGAFGSGHAARAPLEGMLAVICCENPQEGRYTIHFQRSSARSFVDHVSHAATSVCGPAVSGGH